jgi:hypothetical protein
MLTRAKAQLPLPGPRVTLLKLGEPTGLDGVEVMPRSAEPHVGQTPIAEVLQIRGCNAVTAKEHLLQSFAESSRKLEHQLIHGNLHISRRELRLWLPIDVTANTRIPILRTRKAQN